MTGLVIPFASFLDTIICPRCTEHFNKNGLHIEMSLRPDGRLLLTRSLRFRCTRGLLTHPRHIRTKLAQMRIGVVQFDPKVRRTWATARAGSSF